MIQKKPNQYHRKYYREELLVEITGKSKRALQAWFRRNEKGVDNPQDFLIYLERFRR